MEQYKDTNPFGTSCPNPEIIVLIGRLELAKRDRGFSEQNMYSLEKSLKDPEYRKKLAAKSKEGHTEQDLEQLYDNLKFRRKLFRNLKKDSREYQKRVAETIEKAEENAQKEIEKSKENQQKIEINQNIKENSDGTNID
jgi:hypothetical protein